MAEKWESNADATEFTFTIKKGQGSPTATRCCRRASSTPGTATARPTSPRPTATSSTTSRAAQDLQDGTVKDLDDAIVADDTAMTLKVTLEAPNADFPSIVSHPFFGPLPEKVVSKLTDQTQWDKGIMIGNGPFKMETPANEQEVVLVRNDKWAGNVTATRGQARQDRLQDLQGRRVGLHRLRVRRRR